MHQATVVRTLNLRHIFKGIDPIVGRVRLALRKRERIYDAFIRQARTKGALGKMALFESSRHKRP
jgi:hypothetical protein